MFSAKGFTLIEVVIVAAILALLVSIGTMRYTEARATAMRNICIHNQKQLTEHLEIAVLDDPGLSTRFLFEPQIRTILVDGGYMRKIYDCPWGIYFTDEQSVVRCSYVGGAAGCGGEINKPHLLESQGQSVFIPATAPVSEPSAEPASAPVSETTG